MVKLIITYESDNVNNKSQKNYNYFVDFLSAIMKYYLNKDTLTVDNNA